MTLNFESNPYQIIVPNEKEDYMVLEQKGGNPQMGWILIAGRAEAVDPTDELDQAETLSDADDVIMLETNAILQMETTVEYRFFNP